MLFFERFHPRGVGRVVRRIERGLSGEVGNGSGLFPIVPIVQIIEPSLLLIFLQLPKQDIRGGLIGLIGD
jgi:hypothetical protein